MSTTYVGYLHVTRTVSTPVETSGALTYGGRPVAPTKPVKVTSEFKLTVRAPSLAELVDKVDKHLALVDDQDFEGES
jgi:hypothetical protein